MSHEYITKEDFEKHSEENAKDFANIMHRIDASEEERRKRHEDVMSNLNKTNDAVSEMNKKLSPIFEAFDFKRKLDAKGMAAIVKWTKILGLILAIGAVVTLVINLLKFYLIQIKL